MFESCHGSRYPVNSWRQPCAAAMVDGWVHMFMAGHGGAGVTCSSHHKRPAASPRPRPHAFRFHRFLRACRCLFGGVGCCSFVQWNLGCRSSQRELIRYKRIAKWIIDTLTAPTAPSASCAALGGDNGEGPPPRPLQLLRRFIAFVEPSVSPRVERELDICAGACRFFHPSNSGAWSTPLAQLVCSLCELFARRVATGLLSSFFFPGTSPPSPLPPPLSPFVFDRTPRTSVGVAPSAVDTSRDHRVH